MAKKDAEGFTELNITRDVKVFENEGDMVEGRFVGIENMHVSNRDVKCLLLEDADGTQTLVPMATNLQRVPAQIQRNQVIRILYEGEQNTKGGNKIKMFRVFAK